MSLRRKIHDDQICAGAWPPDVESSSETYARRFSGPVGDWFLRVQEVATLQMVADYPNAQVLDVGGGHGQLAPALVRLGHHVTVLGSEASSRRRIDSLLGSGRCEYKTGSLLALPFPDRAFPIVLCYRLMAHVFRWETFLAELTRVADEAVIFDCPTKRSMNVAAPMLFRMKKLFEGDTRPFQIFSESELVGFASQHGFILRDRIPQYFFPMALHRALGRPRLSSRLEHTARRIGITERFGSPVILKLVRMTR